MAWTSHPGGVNDPGAQNVVFDVAVLPAAIAYGAVFVTIEGVGLADLKNVNNFSALQPDGSYAPWGIRFSAGMMGGLPLSEAQPPAGVIFQGQVMEAFGNWQGTEMSLSFLIVPSVHTYDHPANLVLDWNKGQDLSSATALMLHQAYPSHAILMEIQPGMVNASHRPHYTATLKQMAEHILNVTQQWGGVQSYPGVSIAMHNNTIRVFDGTTAGASTPVQLHYENLIGQPVWTTSDTLMITTVMRSDINVGDVIEMPQRFTNNPGYVITRPTLDNYGLNYDVIFKGKFLVTGVRQIGDFRSGDGAQWATVIQAVGMIG
jgi:hypothetical protein